MNNELGAFISFKDGENLAERFRQAKDMGFDSCQLSIWKEKYYCEENALKVKAALEETGFKISTLWAGWDGPREWNYVYGPTTIGLVPPAYRDARANALIKASDFAEIVGIKNIATHVGFIPIDMKHPDFVGTAAALRHVVRYMATKGQVFLFETGQETPNTIVNMIDTIGLANLGINFDTANLILYGTGNSVDAVDIFGKYIRDTHIKDGFYPTEVGKCGEQVRVGEGRANVPLIIKKLRAIGYTGPFTIEREHVGEGEQQKDIALTRELLIKWMAEADAEAEAEAKA